MKRFFAYSICLIAILAAFAAYSEEKPSSEGAGFSGDTVDLQSDEQAGAVGESETKVDPADLMYCEAHMKLARRHFKQGNLARAKEELELVIERMPDHAEARFMRAVTAAKEKDFKTAWHHIVVAEKKTPDNPNIADFIKRLEKAMPRPSDSEIAQETVSRPVPKHASEALIDAIEMLFANKTASAKIVGIGCSEFKTDDSEATAKLTFESEAPLDIDQIQNVLKPLPNITVGEHSTASEGRILTFSITISAIPPVNPEPAKVSNISDLIKSASEDTDVALKDSSESEPDADGHVSGAYTVVAADFHTMGDFMRKILSQAIYGYIVHLASTNMNARDVWKGEVRFTFVTR